MGKSTLLTLPLTLIILFFTFAPWWPRVILRAAGAHERVRHAGPPGSDQPSRAGIRFEMHVVLLVGMAVGVDYSLFYLKREREGAGRRTRDAHRGGSRDLGSRGSDLRPETGEVAMAGMYRAESRISPRTRPARSWSWPSPSPDP